MAKAKLVNIEIRWSTGEHYWVAMEKISSIWDVFGISIGQTKIAFIKEIVAELKERIAAGEYGFTLRIRNKAGKFVSERTYPRSADPKRSKG